MDIPLALIFLGLLIFSAHLFNGLFKFTRIPNVLLLMIIGMVVGPILHLVGPEQFGDAGKIFTTVTLTLLLFESGVNLKIGELMQSIGSSFLLTVFNFLATATISAVLALAFGPEMELLPSIFFGVIVAGTSSAVVIPVIRQLKLHQKGSMILLLESTLSDVLCLVIGLALLASMRQGTVDVGQIGNKMWQSFLLAALVGVVGGFAWSVLLNWVRNLQNAIFTNPAMVFIIFGLTEYMGWNGGIATMMFGICLGNAYLLNPKGEGQSQPIARLDETEKSFFSELVFILSTYFFVYVGISMKFGSWGIFAIALFIVLAVMAVRPFSVAWFVRTPMPLKDLSIMGVMAPKGLVPAILATLPIQYGIAGGETIRDLAYAVVLSSIVIGALVVLLISKDWWPLPYPARLLAKRSLEPQQETEVAAAPVAAAPEDAAGPGAMPPEAPSDDGEPPAPDSDSTTTTE